MPTSRADLDAGRVEFRGIIKRGAVIAPVHPGEILKETLDGHALSPYRLAKDIGVPPNRITAILAGERAVSAETALRLGRYFGTSPQMWLNLQASHDLEIARRERGEEIDRTVTPRGA